MIAAYPVREISYLFCMTSTAERQDVHDAPQQAVYSPLAAARRAAGLTVVDLARSTGLSERQISRIERGLQQPRRSTRKLLADALGMQLHDVWPQHTPPSPVAIGGPRPVGDDDAAIWAYRQAGDATGAGELLGIHQETMRQRLNRAGCRPRPRGGSNSEGIESLASWARKLGVPVEQAIDAAAKGRVPGAFVQTLDDPVIGCRWAVRKDPS